MRALRPGGALICCGSTSSPQPGADLQRLFFLQIRVEGSAMGTRQELVDLLAFVDCAGISPQIGLELPLHQARDGFQAMLEGHTAGKIVSTMNGRGVRRIAACGVFDNTGQSNTNDTVTPVR